MKKYSDQQKLLAVQDYEKGLGSLRTVAKAHNINVSSLRIWIADYRVHGIAGIQNISHTRRYFSREFKLSVVKRMEQDGLSCRQAAALFNLRKFDQIAEWMRQYEKGGPKALTDYRKDKQTRKMRQKKIQAVSQPVTDDALSREKMLAELNRLRAESAYLKKLSALAPANKQSATLRKHK